MKAPDHMITVFVVQVVRGMEGSKEKGEKIAGVEKNNLRVRG